MARFIADHVALAVSHEQLAEAALQVSAAHSRAERLESRVQSLVEELESKAGHARVIGQSPAGRPLQYAGSTFGFASVCDLYPDAKVAVVLLSNKAADDAQETLRAMSAKIVELAAPAKPAAPAGTVSPSPSSAGVPPPVR